MAPEPNTSAGTAMNVYAVYRSPPSRNQVTKAPKPRPPSPHSFRCSMSSVRRQRAAAKPTPVTTRNRMTTMVNVVALTWLRSEPAPAEPPLVQVQHVLGPPPARRGEAHAGDDEEQDDHDGERGGVDVAHFGTSLMPAACEPSEPSEPPGGRSRFCS